MKLQKLYAWLCIRETKRKIPVIDRMYRVNEPFFLCLRIPRSILLPLWNFIFNVGLEIPQGNIRGNFRLDTTATLIRGTIRIDAMKLEARRSNIQRQRFKKLSRKSRVGGRR